MSQQQTGADAEIARLHALACRLDEKAKYFADEELKLRRALMSVRGFIDSCGFDEEEHAGLLAEDDECDQPDRCCKCGARAELQAIEAVLKPRKTFWTG